MGAEKNIRYQIAACARWIAVAVVLAIGPCFSTAQEGAKYTSIAQIRSLARESLDARAAVEFEGVVVGRNLDQRRLFVQEDDAGLIVWPPSESDLPPRGARVRVTGHTTRELRASVRARAIEVLQLATELPAPRKVSVFQLSSLPKHPGEWVEVSGLAMTVHTNFASAVKPYTRNRVLIQLRQSNQVAVVNAPIPGAEHIRQAIFSRLTIRGIQATTALAGDDGGYRVLWVNDWKDVTVMREGPADPFAIAWSIVGKALAPTNAPEVDVPVKLRTRVVSAVGRKVELADASGTIPARQTVGTPLRTGEVVDVLCFIEERASGRLLKLAEFRRLALPRDRLNDIAAANNFSGYVFSLGAIAQLESLTDDEVKSGRPVSMIGVVTLRDESSRTFYLQQGQSRGAKVFLSGTNTMPAVADVVTLKGYSAPGLRRPSIDGRSVKVMRSNQPAAARYIAFADFFDARYTGVLLSLRGVVRSVEQIDDRMAQLRVKWQRQMVHVRVPLADGGLPWPLIDAEVRVNGVSVPVRLPHGRLRETLLLNSPDEVEVRLAAPADPFSLPVVPVGELLAGNPQTHRQHVRGTVTLADANRIFIEDETGGVLAHFNSRPNLSPGDRVAIAGFRDEGPIQPQLGDAVVRKLGSGPELSATMVSSEQITSLPLHARRVSTEGAVVGHSLSGRQRLELSDKNSFAAELPAGLPEKTVSQWKIGSRVRVTGVCQFLGVSDDGVDGFRVLLNGPDAVELLAKPSWWTFGNTIMVVGGLGLLAIGALGWAAYFRRRASQSHRRFLTSFHANPMPAWIVDTETGRCREINAAFENLFGPRANEPEIWATPKDRGHLIDKLRGDGLVRAEEQQLVGRSGQTLSMLLSSEPIEFGGRACQLLVAYDVTERLQLLRQLQQSQKMEAVGQLAAGIAHDFNNLMTIVRSNIGILQQDEQLTQDSRALADDIDGAANRAATLTSQLLAFSRKSIMRPRTMDLRPAVQNSCDALRRIVSGTIDVDLHLPGEPLLIKADSSMLDQVLLNLGANARDAMPNGGTLTVECRAVEYARSDLSANLDAMPGRFALLVVSDTGGGMNEIVKEHAFDPFYTTKDIGKGAGLGLATIYGIIRQHDGWIDLESEPGQGATFRIHLPLIDSRTDAEATPPPSAAGRRGTEHPRR